VVQVVGYFEKGNEDEAILLNDALTLQAEDDKERHALAIVLVGLQTAKSRERREETGLPQACKVEPTGCH
jgi:hypothetical protein